MHLHVWNYISLITSYISLYLSFLFPTTQLIILGSCSTYNFQSFIKTETWQLMGFVWIRLASVSLSLLFVSPLLDLEIQDTLAILIWEHNKSPKPLIVWLSHVALTCHEPTWLRRLFFLSLPSLPAAGQKRILDKGLSATIRVS